jgi:hypothetical protein
VPQRFESNVAARGKPLADVDRGRNHPLQAVVVDPCEVLPLDRSVTAYRRIARCQARSVLAYRSIP